MADEWTYDAFQKLRGVKDWALHAEGSFVCCICGDSVVGEFGNDPAPIVEDEGAVLQVLRLECRAESAAEGCERSCQSC